MGHVNTTRVRKHKTHIDYTLFEHSTNHSTSNIGIMTRQTVCNGGRADASIHCDHHTQIIYTYELKIVE